MSLTSGKAAFKAALQTFADNIDKDKDTGVAIDEFVNALETFIKSATVTVPGAGLTAGATPITGASITGGLS